MSTQLSLRDSFERERRRVRERRAAQYTAAKRARAERGIGSVGLPDDVLEEVVLLSCVRTVGRLRAASVEFKDAVEAHERLARVARERTIDVSSARARGRRGRARERVG